MPRDRLAECVFYLRYGQAPAHANLSNIWYSKPKIAKMLGVSNLEVNRILKDELPQHLKPTLLTDNKKAVLTEEQVTFLTSIETMKK